MAYQISDMIFSPNGHDYPNPSPSTKSQKDAQYLRNSSIGALKKLTVWINERALAERMSSSHETSGGRQGGTEETAWIYIL